MGGGVGAQGGGVGARGGGVAATVLSVGVTLRSSVRFSVVDTGASDVAPTRRSANPIVLGSGIADDRDFDTAFPFAGAASLRSATGSADLGGEDTARCSAAATSPEGGFSCAGDSDRGCGVGDNGRISVDE
jgi:hypothetical protein